MLYRVLDFLMVGPDNKGILIMWSDNKEIFIAIPDNKGILIVCSDNKEIFIV